MKITFTDMGKMNAAAYCRKIMKQSDYPKVLEIYRGEMLCLTVDVEKMAKLRLVENDKKGLHYVKYKQPDQDKLKTYPRNGVSLDPVCV